MSAVNGVDPATLSVTTNSHEVRPDWLARRGEDALEAELPIVDSHHHFWETASARYLAEEFLADVATGHNIIASVYVQSGANFRTGGPRRLRAVGETEFAVAEAARASRIGNNRTQVAAAIVGPLDFSPGAATQEVIEAHVAAGDGRLRGMRGMTHWHEDGEIHKFDNAPGMLASAAVREAAAVLDRMDLALDVFCYHTQLDELAALARAFPDLRIVLDHVGMPLGLASYAHRRDEVFGQWRAELRELGSLENVAVKIGGMGMRFTGFDFNHRADPPSSDDLAAAFGPYVETCIETFGPARCMFESNFPVDKSACSYTVLWNAFKKLVAGYSHDEKASLFAGTAAGIYAIDLRR